MCVCLSDLCLAQYIVNLSIFWNKSFLLISLICVVLCFVQQSGIRASTSSTDNPDSSSKIAGKEWGSLLSMQLLQNIHKLSPVYPHLASLSLIINLFLIANHPMKVCLGIANWNQRNFHQSTSTSNCFTLISL